MEQSLSIIVAAHNAENTIAGQVTDLLEVATDLTSNIEVLVVDDGSDDNTEEVAYELTRQYPQVRLVRHKQQRGVAAAVRTGMEHTEGDVVLVQQKATPVRASDVQRLWALREDEDLLLARAGAEPKPLDHGLLQRLMAWGAKVQQTMEAKPGGLQMIRRQAADQAGDQLEIELSRVEDPAHTPASHIRSPNFITRARQKQR